LAYTGSSTIVVPSLYVCVSVFMSIDVYELGIDPRRKKLARGNTACNIALSSIFFLSGYTAQHIVARMIYVRQSRGTAGRSV